MFAGEYNNLIILFIFKDSIFNECFSGNNEPTVIIGNWTNYRSTYLLESSSRPVYLLGNEKADNLENHKSEKQCYLDSTDTAIMRRSPVKKVFFNEISLERFELILHKFKHSALYNAHGFFLIKNVQTMNSCNDSYFFLNMTWPFTIPNAMFLCHHLDFGISLYTFNPYSAVAPEFWKKIKTYAQENGNALTLFSNANHTIGTYGKL